MGKQSGLFPFPYIGLGAMKQNPQPSTPQILSVGQCGFAQMMISDYLTARFNAQVLEANGLDDVLEAMRSTPFDLVLVNRVLDRDGSSGLDLIRALKKDP